MTGGYFRASLVSTYRSFSVLRLSSACFAAMVWLCCSLSSSALRFLTSRSASALCLKRGYFFLLFLVVALEVGELLLEQLDSGLFADLEGLELGADDLELLGVVVALPVEFLVRQHLVLQLQVELADPGPQVVEDDRLVGRVRLAPEEAGRLDVARVGDQVVAHA